MSRYASLIVVAVLALGLAPGAHAVTEVQWWYSNTGALGKELNKIATDFNARQSDYKIVPVFKGGYADSMAAAIAAFRAGKAPAILQVFEVGTATMMAAKGAIVPVYKVMKEGGEKFDPNAYIPAIRTYFSDSHGRMLSLPFNISTPVFYYNKDAFAKAGLDTAKPPATWPEFAKDAEKLKAAGVSCPFTTAWLSWIQLENFSAWHNLPFASNHNGFGGLNTRLRFNGPLQVRHITNLAKWHSEGLFVYGGRHSGPEAMMISGKCAMLTSSSGAYGKIVSRAKFKFGVAPLPYYPDVKGAPQNTIIGGATLWVMAGQPKDVYKGVAKFFAYLSTPAVQAEWAEKTGYLPVTKAAFDLLKKQGKLDQLPSVDVGIRELNNKAPTANSQGLRLGNFLQIRSVIDDQLEAVWSGKKTAKQGLDEAVSRGDTWLAKFAAANK
jgi:sn-glycerol 3-phosphate transport system substrate-binding protein